ncbi:hypothetical protein U1Q18_030875 [Sarracenia purpurea var. burkii]
MLNNAMWFSKAYSIEDRGGNWLKLKRSPCESSRWKFSRWFIEIICVVSAFAKLQKLLGSMLSCVRSLKCIDLIPSSYLSLCQNAVVIAKMQSSLDY